MKGLLYNVYPAAIVRTTSSPQIGATAFPGVTASQRLYRTTAPPLLPLKRHLPDHPNVAETEPDECPSQKGSQNEAKRNRGCQMQETPSGSIHEDHPPSPFSFSKLTKQEKNVVDRAFE
jgi:hypothetical protein